MTSPICFCLHSAPTQDVMSLVSGKGWLREHQLEE